MNKSNVLVSMEDYMGKQNMLHFDGIPVRISDAILKTENVIS
jgi:hypothetical protein